jgi:hypothetical protein
VDEGPSLVAAAVGACERVEASRGECCCRPTCMIITSWPGLRVGCSPVGGLERADALDDARSETFTSIDTEARSEDFWV